MLNAIQPESYLPPHKHLVKTEGFIVLRGRLLIIEYDEKGNVKESVIIGTKDKDKGVEISLDTWHNIISLEKDSVVYEILDGPYTQEEHKRFPNWAPREEDYKEGMKFIEKVKKQILEKLT